MKYRKILPWILLIPTFIVIIIFIYWPAGLSFRLSAYRQAPFGRGEIFVGWRNFENLFNNQEYINAITTTVIYVLVTVSATVLLSFLLAQLLNQKLPGTKLYRLFIFAPYAISPTIAATLWASLLNPVVGHVNYAFMQLFGINVNWITSTPYALYAILFASIWKMLPFGIIFYLAGLQSIPDSVIESSLIDGANVWKRMWKIKFPLLSPITFYIIIMTFISAMFNSFGIIDIMTRGGPRGYTTTMVYKLYLDAFRFNQTGSAAAQTIVLFVIMGIVTFLYFKLTEKKVHYR